MKITSEFLEKHDACSDQYKLFRKTFPKGAVINLSNAHRAAAAGLMVKSGDYKPSARSHGTVKPVWRSTVYVP